MHCIGWLMNQLGPGKEEQMAAFWEMLDSEAYHQLQRFSQ